MTFLIACLFGIAGTALMTLFMYAMSYITHRPVKVVKILGTMITFQTTPDKGLSNKTSVILVGIIAHYLIGVLFALVFVFLYQQHLLVPTFTNCIIFGFLSGLVGIIIWRIFFSIHPNPPTIPLKTYLTDLLIAHLIFGVGIWIVYKMIS